MTAFNISVSEMLGRYRHKFVKLISTKINSIRLKIMFRKRKNIDVAEDVFTFQLNKTFESEKNGDTIIKTIRPMVTNKDVAFESVSPMPSVTDCLQAGITLKEVPTDGILDSSDNLDYNADDAEEKILSRVEKIVEKTTKKEPSKKEPNK